MSLDLRYREVKSLSSQVLSMVLNMLGGDSGSVMLLDSTEKVLKITSYRGIPSEIAEKVRESLGEGIAGYALKKKVSLILNSGDTFLGKPLTRSDISSSIVLPVLDGEKRIGVININRSLDKEAFSMEDLEFANLLSRYFSTLMRGVLAFHKSLEYARRIRAQYRIIRNISKHRNLNFMMRRLLQDLVRFAKASSGAIGTYEGDTFRIVGTVPDELLQDLRKDIENLFNKAMYEKKEIFIGNTIVFPFIHKDEIFGAIYLAFDGNLPESREIKRLRVLLRDVTLSIKNLSNYLSLREVISREERARITNILHDRVCQGVTEGILKVQYMKKKKLSRDVLEEIDELEILLKNILNDVRCIIYEEKPMILDGGFFDGLRRYIEGIEKASGIKFNLNLSGNERLIPKRIRETIFSVIREAIVNVRRHSGASLVDIDFRVDEDGINVDIADNGIGFDYEVLKDKCNSFGIRIMEDRIHSLEGDFKIVSVPSRGTRVRFYVPL